MKGLGRRLYMTAIVAASVVTSLVVYNNQTNGFYKADSDSIGIPIFLTALVAIALLLLLALQMPFCTKVLRRQAASGLAVGSSLLSTACSLILILMCLLYWYGPSHFFAFWIYVLVAVCYLRFQVQVYRIYFRRQV